MGLGSCGARGAQQAAWSECSAGAPAAISSKGRLRQVIGGSVGRPTGAPRIRASPEGFSTSIESVTTDATAIGMLADYKQFSSLSVIVNIKMIF